MLRLTPLLIHFGLFFIFLRPKLSVVKQLYLEIVIESHTITNYQNGHVINCKFKVSTRIIFRRLLQLFSFFATMCSVVIIFIYMNEIESKTYQICSAFPI